LTTPLSCNVLTSEAQLLEFVEYALQQDAFAFDLETSGENRGVPHLASVSWVSLATKGRTVVISFDHPIGTKVVGETKEPRKQSNGIKMFRVPVYEPAPEQLDRATAFKILEPLFFNDNVVKVAHGAQFDLATIAKYYGGRVPTGPICCSITLQWLVNENLKRYGLKYRTKDVYGFQYDDEDVGKCIEKYPYNVVAYYSYCDALYCYLEYTRLIGFIAQYKLTDIYNMEMDVLRLLAHIRLTGIRVDEERLEEMKAELKPLIGELEAKVYQAAGRKFNVGSWQQIQDVLFLPKKDGGQGLRPWKLTKSAKDRQKVAKKRDEDFAPGHRDWSTDDEAITTWKETNDVCAALSDYRDVAKILNTYVLGYLGNESEVKKEQKPRRIYDGRIYTDLVQYGTVTGRYSSRDPNLQNVPAPDPDDPRNLGKLIRGVFLADEGGKLIVADYDQIELVILAHFLQQGALYDGFFQGIDPHTMTAAKVISKDPADITPKERKKYGKSLNFAVVYGAGIMKVASMIGGTKEDAKAVLGRHAAEFPEIYDYKDYVISQCRSRKNPHIRTLMGRIRRVPEINWSDDGMRAYAERQAFNSLIQGSSADLIKYAQVRYEDLRASSDLMACKQLITVHDELVTTAPDSLVDAGSSLLREAMTGEGIQSLVSVPLKVELAVVSRWSDAK
jgi:DNA polymerase I-like protein with 3'-5' exonuclease and polymerase domains